MNYLNILGVVISQFGFTYGALAAYSNTYISRSYFGFGLWFIGLIFLLYEDKTND
jgi:hypothetical protein